MASPAQSLIIHCQVFWPDNSATAQLITAVAEDAAKQGRKVTVVTSARGYNLDETYLKREEYAGILILRVKGLRWDRHAFAGRLANYFSFAFLSWIKLLLLPRHDCLVVTSTPPISLFIGWSARLMRGMPFVYVVHDLYPEIAIACGLLKAGSMIARGVEWAFDWAMRRAAEIIVLGDYMRQRVLQAHRRLEPDHIHTIDNWHDGRILFPLPHQAAAATPICFQYSGNLGEGHDFGTLSAAMALFRGCQDVRFEFIGRGKRRPYLEDQARQLDLRNCGFSDYVPIDRLNESLNRADVCIVTVKPGFEGLIVPSKIYGIMAVGRPVLYIGPAEGEIPDLVRKHRIGWIVRCGDVAGLASAIEEGINDSEKRRVYGENSRTAFVEQYDRPLGTARYLAVFDKAACR